MCHKCKLAYDLLAAQFGHRTASDLLWNETAYPFDGDVTLRQVHAIIKRLARKAKKRAR